jgi:chemotaxis protein histidine kinase CheA
MLNELVGRFTLDPLAFSRMKPAEQFDAMKALVPGFDFDQSLADDKAAYDARTVYNRKAKEYRAAADAIPAGDWIKAPVDEEPILANLARAGDHNAAITERKARRDEAKRAAESHRGRASAVRLEIETLRQRIADLEAMATEADDQAKALEEKLAAAPPLPEPIDTAETARQLEEAKKINAAWTAQTQRQELVKKANDAEASAESLTEAMKERAQERSEAIQAAKLPVEGLTLGNGEVLVDGLPFAQAAASKKIRISVALAMALNPKIRVIRIMDGSLLDADAQKIVSDMALERGFQVWIETVQSNSPAAVVIEDGHIKEA